MHVQLIVRNIDFIFPQNLEYPFEKIKLDVPKHARISPDAQCKIQRACPVFRQAEEGCGHRNDTFVLFDKLIYHSFDGGHVGVIGNGQRDVKSAERHAAVIGNYRTEHRAVGNNHSEIVGSDNLYRKELDLLDRSRRTADIDIISRLKGLGKNEQYPVGKAG